MTTSIDSDSDSHSTSSEAARERETFKYDALEISTAAFRNPESAKPIPSAVLSSTPDPGLTAFAQLGLYRLGGSRALVSLFDRKSQHIVAEAVRATPLNLNEDQLGQLWLCGTAVPRTTSICEHVLAGPASSLTIPGNDTGDTPSDLPVSVVLNLDEDARFCDVQDTAKRFYIGVPIRSPAGINIGVYCVFDDKPRQYVSAEEIQFIRDVSVTVMSYLEAKRSHECYRREERMVRGLGSFVEGKAMLSNWSQASNPSSFKDVPGVHEGHLNKRLRGESTDGELPSREVVKSPVRDTFSAPTRTRSVRRKKTDPSLPRTGSRFSPADVLQAELESVFSKASNIIRESIEVEGVAYLDASIKTFGGLVGQELPSQPVLGKAASDLESSGDDEIPSERSEDGAEQAAAETTCCKVLGYSTSQSSSVNGDRPGSALATFPERFLHYLLQRHPHGKIYNMDARSADRVSDHTLPWSCSSRRKRSETEVITNHLISAITSATSSNTTNGISNDTNKTEKPLKVHPTITAILARMFPGARSVAFVPLWDPQRNRWFAGSFVWTCTPTRIFTAENELSYLKAFGLTIMAEVTRLHIKAADKTKMDVLGAISHELRSPLHAVVGAAELLRQTSLDGSQEGILRTIQISSTTLLDTIDHLLDYGKMNPLLKTAGLERSNSGRLRLRQDPVTTVSEPLLNVPPVQLDLLAEEVVESVLAGFGYMHSSPGMSDTPDATTPPTEYILPGRDTSGKSHGVQVLFDIEPAQSWSYRIHPGAFRRIIMNLFGNALKFTKAGFIKVHLKQETPTEGRSAGDTHPLQQDAGFGKIVLTVSDTGRGISEEYLRNQLYTPFAQEDQFAPGTGLGLSLVRQLVTTLGGEIHVTSQVGCGTSVNVILPLPAGPGTSSEQEGDFKEFAQELAASRVLLRGCGRKPSATESPGPDKQNGANDQQVKMQLDLIKSICAGWLGMQVVSQDLQADGPPPDFVVSTGECPRDSDAGGGALEPCPHVRVCQCPGAGKFSTAQRQSGLASAFERISQPLGPRKLAKALLDSRQRWKDAQARPPTPPSSVASLSKDKSGATSPTKEPPLLLSTPSQAAVVTTVLKDAGIIEHRSSSLPPSPPEPHHATDTEVQPRNTDTLSIRPTPVPIQHHPPPTPTSPVSDGHANIPRSVLIVDDNPINRKILAAYMKRISLPHSTAADGLEALEMYKAAPGKYSCLLTDVSMPVMDGIESSRRVREFERARARAGQLAPCKIIAITGLSGANVQQDAFASGVDLFLTRPVTLKHIVAALEELGVR
ncbi:hsp90-like protein [Chaetomium strumarium]|uniref:histidine kinase n=1 Tax=Chaetomium strumarium TaxID=1170767 RepID=A0AAJ0GPN0_9PEZI|nr:hsp90-like protein [Chaetomium strumarium]